MDFYGGGLSLADREVFRGGEELEARRAAIYFHTVRKGGAATVQAVSHFNAQWTVLLRAKFRADQLFEPNADGADMIIPEIALRVQAPSAPGVHPIRIFGKAASGGATAEAHTCTMIGPIYQGDWNFYRRPVPGLTLTVIE